MDPNTMTQITLLSITVTYLWILVLVVITTAVVVRRRRIARMELEFARRLHARLHPPSYAPAAYFGAVETQETPVLALHMQSPESTRRLRHINPSDQVAISISPDSEPLNGAKPLLQQQFKRITATFKRANSQR
jgi:hypothetical protein